MSALSILYLVLPFPLAFILHDAEEAIVQHRWMLSHRYIFEDKYPRIKPLFKYLSSLDTQSFVIAALEEFVILILCTCYVLIQGNYCVEIWSALFIAFSFHLLIHIIQAIVLKSYVPGLITSVLLIPYSYLGMQSIWYAMNGVELFLWGVAGIIFMAMNLIFAHWIGKICHKTHFAHNYQKDTMIMDNKRSAIVMGATSGIGHEVALILARRGWRIGVAGRREDILAKMSDEIDGVVAYEVIDVNTPEAVDGLHKLIGKLGGMHLYFHSSGIGYQNTALDAGKELTTIETNCLGMARLVGEAFRYFEQHPETDGQIAVISSISRTKGLGAAPAYSASKRFTSHYLESLCQLTSIRKIHNIHITDIRPGFVKTPLIEGSNFPMQLDARKVAVSIVDGIERRKPVITINWLYRLLVFFWQMIPRSIWIKMKVK